MSTEISWDGIPAKHLAALLAEQPEDSDVHVESHGSTFPVTGLVIENSADPRDGHYVLLQVGPDPQTGYEAVGVVSAMREAAEYMSIGWGEAHT